MLYGRDDPFTHEDWQEEQDRIAAEQDRAEEIPEWQLRDMRRRELIPFDVEARLRG